MELLRDPRHCERELSNALASIHEAITILRQCRPDSEEFMVQRNWDRQLMRLRMAAGCVHNVRDEVTDGLLNEPRKHRRNR